MTTTTISFGEVRAAWPAGATLGEGACWSAREQALYWVDILEGRLFRYTPASGRREQWDFAGETLSAVTERENAPGLVVTLRRGWAFFDPATGALQRLAEPEPERSANRFNDGKCDAAGRFWAGTMDFGCRAPTGAWYRLDADGRCTRAFDAGWPVTNGPTWSADGRTMFLNETEARTVHASRFDPERGELTGELRSFLRFDADDGLPDGMTTDAEGRLWIAHWGGACVTCHDAANGAELARLALPTCHITNIAFGGPGLRTLFVTSARFGLTAAQLGAEPLAGALFAVETNVVGKQANRFAG
jgi:xylono-1,5-lactonase